MNLLQSIFAVSLTLFLWQLEGLRGVHAVEARSNEISASGSSFRLDLKHIESFHPTLATSATALWQRRVERSIARAKDLRQKGQNWKSVQLEAQAPSSSFQTPVTAAQGEYVALLSIGTPPQAFNVILDTGSDLTWIQSDPCRRCYVQTGPHFNPAASSTFSHISCSSAACRQLPLHRCQIDLSCEYAYEYGDLSFTIGNFSKDTITLATLLGSKQSVPGFSFGCGFNNRGTFLYAGGLVGMGRGPISLVSQLGLQMFSYCLVPLKDSFSGKSSLLVLGDAGVISDTATWVTLIFNPTRPSFYYMPLSDMLVDGIPAGIPAGAFQGGTILDSGTTLTSLVDKAFQPLLQAVKAKVQFPTVDVQGVGLELCWTVGSANPVQLPELTFVLEGARMVLPLDNTYVLVENGVLCWAFLRMTAVSYSIVGNVQQQNFQFYYDLGNSRLGFAPADCAGLSQ